MLSEHIHFPYVKNRFFFIILFYTSVACILGLCIFENQVSINAWALEGIFLPVIGFIVISLIFMVLLNENGKVAVVASIFAGLLNVIPALRYTFFYNVYDGPGHYRFAEIIAATGYVPTNEFYSSTYGPDPARHIFFAAISQITGLTVNDAIKFLLPGLFALVPLIIYIIGRHYLTNNTLKYTIIISSIPVMQMYQVWGTTLVFIPYLLLIAVLTLVVVPKNPNKLFFLLFILLSFAVITSHAVTSFLFSIILFCLAFGSILYCRFRTKDLPINFAKYGYVILTFLLILWGWWSIEGTAELENVVTVLKTLLNQPVSVVPTTFLQLPLLAQVQSFFVLNISNAIIALFTAIGLIFIFRSGSKVKIIKEIHRLYIVIIAILLVIGSFVVIQAVANFGVFSYSRLLIYAIPLCFFPIGLAISTIDKLLARYIPKAKSIFMVCMLVAITSLCLVQVYPPQSLVPRSNVISVDLPSNEYVVDLQLVNTVYQKSMIEFAAKYYNAGPVVADIVTRSQCYGFSSEVFFKNIEYTSPLVNGTMTWQILLLHTSKAGALGEQAPYRTSSAIEEIRYNNGDIVYDNGASFVLYNPYVDWTTPGHVK